MLATQIPAARKETSPPGPLSEKRLRGMNDRALVVAPLPAYVGEGRDEVRGEG